VDSKAKKGVYKKRQVEYLFIASKNVVKAVCTTTRRTKGSKLRGRQIKVPVLPEDNASALHEHRKPRLTNSLD
jgi:hypothetical protein